MAQVGEYIRGPFKHATIGGFIIEVTDDHYQFVVKDIEPLVDHEVPSLQYGSVHSFPKEVIDSFYTILSQEDQYSLIQLVKSLNDQTWYEEITRQYNNPFSPPKTIASSEEQDATSETDFIYSEVLDRVIELAGNSKTKLHHFYQEAVQKGITNRVETPAEISDTESLDVVVASIILISKNQEGIEFIRALVNER